MILQLNKTWHFFASTLLILIVAAFFTYLIQETLAFGSDKNHIMRNVFKEPVKPELSTYVTEYVVPHGHDKSQNLRKSKRQIAVPMSSYNSSSTIAMTAPKHFKLFATCPPACIAGQFCNLGSCAPCPAGSMCPGNEVKVLCTPGFTSIAGSASCYPCASTTSSVAPFTSCTACLAGSYCPIGMPSQPCPGGTSSSSAGQSASMACTVCGSGYTSFPGTSAGCTPCTDGWYCTGATSEIPCLSGSYSSVNTATSYTACQACNAGSYSATAGSVTCSSSCTAGFFCIGESSIPCPLGRYSSGGSNSAVLCGQPCSAGTYITPGTGTCAPCPLGTFCLGMVPQLGCPPGKMTVSDSQTSIDDCVITCLEGYYSTGSVAGQAACSVCPGGSYCPGDSKNIQCPVGKYVTATGIAATFSIICVACIPGKYSNGNAISCLSCPVGYYCPGGRYTIACPVGTSSTTPNAISADVCIPCPPGTYSFAGITTVIGL